MYPNSTQVPDILISFYPSLIFHLLSILFNCLFLNYSSFSSSPTTTTSSRSLPSQPWVKEASTIRSIWNRSAYLRGKKSRQRRVEISCCPFLPSFRSTYCRRSSSEYCRRYNLSVYQLPMDIDTVLFEFSTAMLSSILIFLDPAIDLLSHFDELFRIPYYNATSLFWSWNHWTQIEIERAILLAAKLMHLCKFSLFRRCINKRDNRNGIEWYYV